jgi:xylulokinase
MNVVLACDLGGTNFRAALIDVEGVTHAEQVIACPEISDEHGSAEVDADLWWETLLNAARALARKSPVLFQGIEGIAICGVTRTQIFMGDTERPLRSAITWKDSRAARSLEKLLPALPEGHPERAQVNAFHPIARLAWLRDEENATFQRIVAVLEPKDYLNYRLTGRFASDPVSQARLQASAQPDAAGRTLLGVVGASASVVPPLYEPSDQIGVVADDLTAPFDRLAGRPVFCSSNDTWAAAVGLGALRPGFAYNISGTTEVFGVVTQKAAYADGLMTVDWRGLHQLGGPSQNGADTLAWLLSVLGRIDGGRNIGSILEGLLEGRLSAQPLVFLPYLQGERTPYWDPSLRGAFVGLSRSHSAGDLAYAIMEGVAFSNRIILDRAEAALGATVEEIRFGGGGAASAAWRQIKADICERPVVTGASAEPGALGAAIVAWRGLGRFDSLADAQKRLVRVVHRHEPDRAKAKAYRPLFEIFKRCEQALAPISRELVALTGYA